MAKRKKTTEVTENVAPETKEQKLVRLANQRVTRACKYIGLIGNLVAYKPTDEDIDRMMEALGTECAKVEQRLRAKKSAAYNFTLHKG